MYSPVCYTYIYVVGHSCEDTVVNMCHLVFLIVLLQF